MTLLTFDVADQERFARLSGDRNPMHVDPVAARRLLTGRPVVHGVHTLLRLLDGWPDTQPFPEATWHLEGEFLNPLSVADRADVAYERDPDGTARGVATAGGLPCCRLTVRAAPPSGAPTQAIDGAAAEHVTVGERPLDREPSAWPRSVQSLPLPSSTFDAGFPHACRRIGERRVAALAAMSTYVGMVCPGLHSVFASLSVQAGDAADPTLRFRVLKYDARFRLFMVEVDGALRGQLKAFVRAPEQRQASMADLRGLVGHDEFAGGTHWVLGGSRGLGEAVAKLLAAGGARVCLSHAAGAADADRVAAEIREAGGEASCRRLDLLEQDGSDWLQAMPWPDAVWYFPTPRIFRKRASVFDAGVLDEFLHFYVRRFEQLCQVLERAAEGRGVVVFHPSTVFVDERPRGMTEYAMAKAAAEVLIADLAKALRHVRPVAHRLPKLATDQTAGAGAGDALANARALLPVVRAVLQARAT